MKIIIPIVLAASLAGCASAPERQVAKDDGDCKSYGLRNSACATASSEELLNAQIAYDNCLTAAVRQADDGKSDARTIALAIKSKCVPQTVRVTRALASTIVGPGTTFNQAYRTAREIVEEQYLETAVKAVLSIRTGRIQ